MEVNLDDKTAICSVCGPVANIKVRMLKGRYVARICRNQFRESRKRQKAARRMRKPAYAPRLRNYRSYVTGKCSECNFAAVHRCQMDIHHADGNHKNNDPLNLVELCANCHRMKHGAVDGGWFTANTVLGAEKPDDMILSENRLLRSRIKQLEDMYCSS